MTDEAAQARRDAHQETVKDLERAQWIAAMLPFVKRNIRLALAGKPDTLLGVK